MVSKRNAEVHFLRKGETSMRNTKTFLKLFLCPMASLLFFMHPLALSAQMLEDMESGKKPRIFVNASSLYQPESHVHGGGSVAASRCSLSIGSTVPLNDKASLGFGLSYELDNYNFSRLSDFAVPDPWNRINKIGFSTRAGYRISPEWMLFAAPVVQYAGEEGADFGDSLLYGGTVGALYRPNKRFVIGFGGGVFYRLEETSFFPAFIFSWKITDKLRLGNSFRTGPSGPAGLELSYSIDSNWETAIAGGFRSYRFRLDENGPVPNGIGQIDSWPLFARVSRKLGHHLRADLYGGVAFGGKLRLEDSRGRKIDQASFNTAPLAGFALTMFY